MFARLYTGIHAKPKSKLKQGGAICESTTALNVDQRNTTLAQNSADQKNPLSSSGAPSPSPLAPSTASSKGTSCQEQPAVSVGSTPVSNETGGVGSSTAPPQKKDGVALKAQAEKKKIDARKKSLKRL